ncbi:serine hydrolase domain-containing protein [Streptomyces yaizuensis]|uniref:Serine hydrolase n=1 Tax=Streptomyces yaizuensis TaxID=2989713 RepID=A0ABQ5P949_9ACTN|nr:serine hydrolase domain-containing protein [Streptomyces sp. YSPA8]GLF99118.1 serine hydrolase [Streptomyces sp. YSPA8]
MHTPSNENQYQHSSGNGGCAGGGGWHPAEFPARFPAPSPASPIGGAALPVPGPPAPPFGPGVRAGLRPGPLGGDAREHREVPPDLAHWSGRLDALRAEYDVPGASLAILTGGRIHEVATGVLHRGTGAPVTPASLFQLGSIAKVYTATLVTRLADLGALDLDAAVADLVPEFSAAGSPGADRGITVRQLLSHTGGLPCDFSYDPGRGDDCLARYAAAVGSIAPDRPPGLAISYSGTGYAVLGRLVEVVTGQVWDAALRDRLLDPLGLDHTVTLPEEALCFPVAMGHLAGDGGREPTPVPHWDPTPRSLGPARRVVATAADLVRLARMHLAGGTAPGGARVMSVDAVATMQHRETGVPDQWTVGADGWGLGWTLYDWDGIPGFGHDGVGIGQHAFLRVVPETGVAVALLTNGGRARALCRTLLGELLDTLSGVVLPQAFAPAADPPTVDPAPLVGTYRRAGAVITVTESQGRGRLRYEPDERFLMCSVPRDMDLVPVTDKVFAGPAIGAGTMGEWLPVVFTTLPDGSRCVYLGMRAATRYP